MFQVLHPRRQHCQIKENNRVAKNIGQEKDSEKERAENKNPRGGMFGHVQSTGSPTSNQ